MKIKNIIKGWINSFRNKFNGMDKAETEFYNARYWICLNCEKKKYGICLLCGCPVSKKAFSPEEWCPANKWTPILYEGDLINTEEITPLLREKFINFAMTQGFVPCSKWEEFLEKL